MLKLATLLALGTAYLLMFAWIAEVSAEDATVSSSYMRYKMQHRTARTQGLGAHFSAQVQRLSTCTWATVLVKRVCSQ